MVASLMSALPGSVAQGLIWGILAIGVYITYKVLDFADLTVDGSLATGGAVAVICLLTTGFCIVIIALLYWFFGTEIGASVRATGCNPNMARAQGINTNATKVLGLVISNGLVGLAGALYAQYQGSADINMGRGAIVIGLAAVIIGEVVFGKIFHNFALHMVAVVIGAIIYFVVIAIVLQLGLETTDLKLFSSLIVALFLALPYLKSKYFTPADKKGGNGNA